MILNGITASRCLDIKIGPCYLKHCSSLRYAPLCVSATSPKFRSLSIADEGKNVLPFSGMLIFLLYLDISFCLHETFMNLTGIY